MIMVRLWVSDDAVKAPNTTAAKVLSYQRRHCLTLFLDVVVYHNWLFLLLTALGNRPNIL